MRASSNVCRESRVRLQTGVARPSAIGNVVVSWGLLDAPLQFPPSGLRRKPKKPKPYPAAEQPPRGCHDSLEKGLACPGLPCNSHSVS